MRPRVTLLLLLAAAFVVVIFLAGLPEETYEDLDLERPEDVPAGVEAAREFQVGEEAPEGPQLVGRAAHEAELARWVARMEQALAPKTPKHWAVGRVLDADGEPVSGAQVYHLIGDERTSPALGALTTTDDEGRFRMAVDRWAGTTFGARAPLRGAAFVSADALRPTDPISVVLPRPMALDVFVVGTDGTGLEGVSVTAAPLATRRLGVYLPTPDTPEHEQMGVTDASGAVRFVFTRPDPVRITPEIVDATFEPASFRLDRPEGHVTFEARAGCRLVLQVIDTETGDHLREAVHLAVHDADTWAQIDGFRTDDSADEIDETLALSPGAYAIEITARGREPEWMGDIVVEHPGQTFEREVRMRPMSRPGRLIVELPPGARGAPGKPAGFHPLRAFLLVRRLDGGHAVRGYQPVGSAPASAEPGYVVELRPGRYDALLVMPLTNELATLKGLLLVEDEDTRYQVSPRPGTTLRLSDLLPEGVEVESVRVTVPGRGRFPLLGRGLGTSVRSAEALRHHLARLAKLPKAKRKDVILGPYPPEGALIEVTDREGHVHRATTR